MYGKSKYRKKYKAQNNNIDKIEPKSIETNKSYFFSISGKIKIKIYEIKKTTTRTWCSFVVF